MNKFLFLDTETTGLDPKTCGLIKVAFVMDIDEKIADQKLFIMRPFPNKTIEQSAIDINKISFDVIMDYPNPRDVQIDMEGWLDKHIDKYNKVDKAYPVGYNISAFDLPVLTQFYKDCSFDYWGSYINGYRIDLLDRVFQMRLIGKLDLQNYKLETVCKHFGIAIDAHDPMSDCLATRELFYRILIEPMPICEECGVQGWHVRWSRPAREWLCKSCWNVVVKERY